MKRRILAAGVSLALLAGQAPAGVIPTAAAATTGTSTLTVSVSGSTFTIKRSDTSKSKTYYYRTVDESAVAGTHYTAASGTITFPAGTSSKTVTVSEKSVTSVSNVIDRYQNKDRKYRLEVTPRTDDAETTVSAERTISYGSAYNVSSSYYGTEYKIAIPYASSGDSSILVTDDGFGQAVHNIDIGDFFTASGTNAKSYFGAAGTDLYTRLTFKGREVDDGYQYVQIYADNSSDVDGGADSGNPGSISYALYAAGFSHNGGNKDTTYYQYAFPVKNAANNCSRIDGAWNSSSYYSLGNSVGALVTQKFKSDSNRSSDGTYVIAPITTSTLNYRFNASGGQKDRWRVNIPYVHLTLNDSTAPTATNVYAPDWGNYGAHYKGDYATVSVRFSEIVNVTGTPTITTDCGTFSYIGGSGTNTLYFGGDITTDSATTLKLTKISGTIKDMAGNSYATSTTLSLSDSFKVTTSKPSGSGTESSPYIIKNRPQLYWFAEYVNAGNTTACGKLGADITVNPGTFDEDGTYTTAYGEDARAWTAISSYKGTFDGAGYTISGIYISTLSDYQGLFGIVSGGTVKNVTIENSYIEGGCAVGAICGCLADSGTVTGCKNNGSPVVGSYARVGGIAGYVNGGTVSDCENSGSVSDDSAGTGGIAGYTEGSSTISNCTNSGNVTGKDTFTGGIVGRSGSTVSGCGNTGTVSGTSSTGGVVGYNTSGAAVSDCTNAGTVSGTANYVGGVAGYGDGTVSNGKNTGAVSGASYVGGVAGYGKVAVTNGTNGGTVTGTGDYVGGVVGYGAAAVSDCTNTGAVSGASYVGGIAGYGGGTVSSGTNEGKITGTADYVGGIVGEAAHGITDGANSGAVTGGASAVGGIAGKGCDVTNGTNTGTVTGASYVGGIAGYGSGTITKCINDTDAAVTATTSTSGGIVGYNSGALTACINRAAVTGTTSGGIVGSNGGTAGSSYSIGGTGVYGENAGAIELCVCLADTESGGTDGAFARTQTQFNNGAVAYLLNNGDSDGNQIWYQNIDNGETTDAYPVFDSTHGTVYESHLDDDTTSYTNDRTNVTHHYTKDGFCDECNNYQPAIESEGSYYIGNAGQLFWFAALVRGDNTNATDITAAEPNAAGVLTQDIDLGELTWTPIGTADEPYTGTFNGSGLSVTINSTDNTANYAALFGYAQNATVSRVTVKGTISTSASYAAGIVGNGNSVMITECGNEATVSGTNYAAGIIADGSNITVKNCYNTGTVTSSGSVSGVGIFGGTSTVENCYNAQSSIGLASGATLTNCYQIDTDFTSDEMASGKLAHDLQSNITDGTQIWGQTIDGDTTDAHPILTSAAGKKVVKVEFIATDDETITETVYINVGGKVTVPDKTLWWSTDNTTFVEFDENTAIDTDTEIYACDGSDLPTPDGGGTESDPYIIDSVEDLYWFAAAVNGGQTAIYGKLGADIQVNSGTFAEDGTYTAANDETVRPWTPITDYAGTFDGAGYTISGLYISTTDDEQGLFGSINGGTVKNVTIENSYIKGGEYVGAVCGDLNEGTITGCKNGGCYVKGSECVGGVAGKTNGTVSSCTNAGTVSGESSVGGIVGYTDGNASIEECSNSGAVAGTVQIIGGIVGKINCSVSKCENTGTVSAGSAAGVGGIGGYQEEGTVENCKNTGAITGAYAVGGIVGHTTNTIKSSMNIGTVTGTDTDTTGKIYGVNVGAIELCAYLADTSSGDTSSDGTYARTADEFKTGEVAYLLNGGDGIDIWYQYIGTDAYPSLDSSCGKVYQSHPDGVGTTYTYINSDISSRHNFSDDGFCTVCDAYEPANLDNGVYYIGNAGQLFWFADQVNSGMLQDYTFAYLKNNIELGERTFTPIGTADNPFTGSFDGCGYYVNGTIGTADANYQGLFGYVEGNGGFSEIKNVTVKGQVNGANYVAGIVGYAANFMGESCRNEATISGTTCAAGVLGYAANGVIMDSCCNVGTVSGGAGIVGGIAYVIPSVKNCWNAGATSCFAAGITSVTNCYQIDTVTETNGATSKTAEQFKSGEVAYLLDMYDVQVWGQTVASDVGTTDAYPVLTSDAEKKVLKVEFIGTDGTTAVKTAYTNSGMTVDPPTVSGVKYWSTSQTEYVKYDEETQITADTTVYAYSAANFTEPENGDGTEDNPYILTTLVELHWFEAKVNDGETGICAKLGANIVVNNGTFAEDGTFKNAEGEEDTPQEWTPITDYSGTFDGDVYSISGLYISTTDDEQGLFGSIKGGTVKNVTIENSYIKGGEYVGAVCGNLKNEGTITGCKNGGCYVKGSGSVGGVAGRADGTVSSCTNAGTVSGESNVGGIVGYTTGDASIEECSNSGAVAGTVQIIGGIVGQISCSVSKCENTGTVSAGSAGGVGGIGGYQENGTVENCKNTGAITGAFNVGGIVGMATNTIKSSMNIGAVTGTNSDYSDMVGEIYGLYGSPENDEVRGSVVRCYYLNVTADDTTDNGDGTYAATATDFASGEITYLLNNGESDGSQAWYQTLATDDYPMLGGDSTTATVYETHSSGTSVYTNDGSAVKHKFSEDGFCTVDGCGEYEPAIETDGTYYIGNAGQLMWFSAMVRGDSTYAEDATEAHPSINGHLTADIDVSSLKWTPIGTSTNPYYGVFYGNNYTVTLNITDATDCAGLFGYINGAGINTVTVKGSIAGTAASAGIVGCVTGSYGANIIRCGNEANVTVQGASAAGIVGSCDSGCTVNLGDCYNAGTVTAEGSSAAAYAIGNLSETSSVTIGYNSGTLSGGNGISFGGNAALTYCYQLNTINTGDAITSVTAEQVESGELAYALNSYMVGMDFWRQDITSDTKDEHPILSGTSNVPVRKVTFLTKDDSGAFTNEYAAAYTNDGKTVTVPESDSILWSTDKDTYTAFDESTEIYSDMTLYGYTTIDFPPDSGDGTADNPYILDSLSDLEWFAAYVNAGDTSACAKLGANITVNAGKFDADGNYTPYDENSLTTWTPIGGDIPYTGTFDGAGYTISGLYISTKFPVQGLFGRVDGGTVENVTIENSYIKGGYEVGAVCGDLYDGTVTGCTAADCYVTAIDDKLPLAGGIVGCAQGSGISGCVNSGTAVSGAGNDVGGIVGYSIGGCKITRCENSGTVNGTANIGGIAGCIEIGGTATDCKNTGAVSGAGINVGGIVGYAEDSDLKSCMNIGTVTGDDTDTTGAIYGQISSEDTEGSAALCFYLADTAQDNGDGTYAKTADDLKSGEITYLLNNGESDGSQAWYQTLATDDYPMLGGDSTTATVYETHSSGTSVYTNDGSAVKHKFSEDGFCTVDGCGEYEPAEDPSGEGADYYIGNAGQLMWFSAMVRGDSTYAEDATEAHPSINGHLTADIDLGDKTWTPIGGVYTDESTGEDVVFAYTGTFDGACHSVTINNTDTTEKYMGLFGCVGGSAVIENVTVKGTIESAGRTAAGVVAWLSDGVDVTIQNCGNEATVTNTVTGEDTYEERHAVGIVYSGYIASQVSVKNCYNTGKITVAGDLGCALGIGRICTFYELGTSSVENCYNAGEVEGGSLDCKCVGVDDGVSLKNCYQLDADADTEEDGVTSITAEQVESGELAHTLAANSSDGKWEQDITSDTPEDHPVLTRGSLPVLKVTFLTKDDSGAFTKEYAVAYTNKGKTVTVPEVSGTAWSTDEDTYTAFDSTTVVTADTTVYGVSSMPDAVTLQSSAGNTVDQYEGEAVSWWKATLEGKSGPYSITGFNASVTLNDENATTQTVKTEEGTVITGQADIDVYIIVNRAAEKISTVTVSAY